MCPPRDRATAAVKSEQATTCPPSSWAGPVTAAWRVTDIHEYRTYRSITASGRVLEVKIVDVEGDENRPG